MKFFKRKEKPQEKKESATGSVISMYNVGQPVWSGRNYESFAKEGYEQNVVVNRCVSLIAKGIASVDWQVFAGENELPNHPLLALLANPNERQSACDFFEALVSFKLLSGNAYIEAAYPNASLTPSKKPPVYLYTLRPDRMKVIKGTRGRVQGYRYEANSSWVDYPVAMNGLSNILHIKSFHPTDDWYGLSNIESGAYAIDQHNAAAAWNQALLQNSARPSGALVFKGKTGDNAALSDEQFNRLKSDMDENYSNPSRAGKPLLLEGGLEWQEMSMNPKDMDWLEGKHSVARDVALAFGVPAQLLGIPGDSTYNNMQEARLALWEQTILPLLDEITAHFNSWLVPRYGDGITLTYSKENIDALRIKRELQRESLEKTTFMTTNEKRHAMGLERIEGGDELLIDANKIPLGMAGETAPVDTELKAKQLYVETLKELGFKQSEIKQMVLEDATTNEKREVTAD